MYRYMWKIVDAWSGEMRRSSQKSYSSLADANRFLKMHLRGLCPNMDYDDIFVVMYRSVYPFKEWKVIDIPDLDVEDLDSKERLNLAEIIWKLQENDASLVGGDKL